MKKRSLFGIMVVALAVLCFYGAAWAQNYDVEWIRSMGLFKDRYFLLTPEANEALEELNAIFDKDVVMWVASMYDPESGGFYYARSAVGRDGFAADIESTSQALGFAKSQGMLTSMPEHIKEGFIDFFQSRQDPASGYFYDPQFGSKVSDSKRSRNLSQAVGRLRDLGVEPLYPLPYSAARQTASAQPMGGFMNLMGSSRPGAARNAGGFVLASSSQSAASKSGSIPTLPEYLTSADALRRWMKGFDWVNKPWSAGHNLSSARSEIIQVGLLDVVIEFIEEIQNPETGLWGPGRTFEEVSGGMKLSGYYSSGRPYPYVKQMVESTIHAIANYTPASIVHIRNPVDLLSTAVINGSAPFDPEIETLLRENMPMIIRRAKESLLKFKQPDKAFSYSMSGSSRTSQGALVSLGLPEADVNGTMAGANATINYMYQLLGQTRPGLGHYAEEFWDVIVNMPPHESIEVPVGLDEDFEDEQDLLSWISNGPGTASIVVDPHDSGNKVMQIQKTAKGGHSVSKGFDAKEGAEKTRVSFKFMVSEFGTGGAFNLRFGEGGSKRAFALMLAKQQDEYFLSHRATERGYGDRICNIEPNVWYHVDAVYTPAGFDDTELAVYVDGELARVLNDYYRGNDESRPPVRNVKNAEFYAYIDVVASLYVDDVKVTTE